jgi:predicted pyridoxine 5'-phosphate oxidase superfamily flavin-nucleotide-binding protein
MCIIIPWGYDVYFCNKLFFMKCSEKIIDCVLNANSKALATSFDGQINVVPVSTVKFVEGKIWLIDYFFKKTKSNFLNNPKVALSFWTGTKGYQVKAHANYLTVGEEYDSAEEWIAGLHPDRTIKGLLIMEIDQIFDISIS